MAALNKLAIRGIRSFDDKHVQVIEFYSPLTVIVGHNGSGKTTIIECLKYATTGDLPPNTKGGAFVHDPKMANEKEVKAQVRLRFWNVNRQRMTVTRNLQVTVKKAGGLTMKTLEGLLAKSDIDGGDGKRNVISTKCAEMDEEVPQLMGVSKAILENVIFCHQEESNWPLSEPAALKKKFDDIFEATKYTKALDNIKTLRKERTQELKVDKERLQHYKSDKDKAERMRKDIEEAIQKEAAKQAEAKSLEAQTLELKQANQTFYAEATGFQQIFEKFENLKKRKAMLETNREEQLEGMEVMKETTEELENMLRNYDTHLKTVKGKQEKQAELRRKEDEGLAELRRRERNLATTQGGLAANRKAYERNLRERESAVRDVAKAHNFAGFDYSPLEDSKIVEFVDKIHELVRKAEADMKKLQVEGARKEREMQAELDRLASAKTSAMATKRSKQDQISKLNDKIRTTESSFDSVSSFDAEIQLLEGKLAENAESQAKLEADIASARYEDQIREKTNLIRQKEGERDKIQGELSVLNRQADSRAQLTIKRNELKSKQGQVEASTVSHAPRFKELVNEDLVPDTMEVKITTAVGRKDRELQEAEASASASNRTLSQAQASTNIAKQSLKDKRDELSRLEKELNDALEESEDGIVTIAGGLEKATTEVGRLSNLVSNHEAIGKWWGKQQDFCKLNHKCDACNRPVESGSSEERAILQHMQAQITKLTSVKGLKAVEEQHEYWQEWYDKYQELLPSELSVDNLKSKVIPELERKVAAESAKIDQLAEEVEETKSRVARAKVAVRDLQTLKSAASMLTRTMGEVRDLTSDISRLERDLQASGSLKTVEDVQREVDVISNEMEQSSLSGERDLKSNSLRGLQTDQNRGSLKLGQLKNKQERRQRDEAALKELQDTLVALQADLKELDAAAQAAEAPWKEKNDGLNRYRTDRANAENEASLEVGMFQSSLNEIESKHRACQAYITEGNDRKIRENESQIEDLKVEMSAAVDSRANIEKTLQSLLKEVATAESLKSNISQNMRYRKGEKDIRQVQEEIEDIDIESAAKSRKDFNTRYAKNMEEENKTQNAWQMASGALQQMAENRKKIQATLKSDYANTDKLFKEQLIKTKISEFANNDLEKYGKALDNAILKYHSIKMDEINDTIGHLWNKTYQGTDIDGIKIRSDSDETSTSARKSYNYRVCMVKNDVELDMRGRCSAGQKVLASIIIRLALAESFGQGCGVLALDEPTTNLDQENINALAEALAEIIRERRRQANFQLIVITHDEGFLNRLAAHDCLESYWRVSRDASQKSIVEKQRVGL